MNPKLACHYVGQTSHNPNTGFKQHKTGYKATRLVKKYGIRLKPRRFKKYNPIEKRQETEYTEQILRGNLGRKDMVYGQINY